MTAVLVALGLCSMGAYAMLTSDDDCGAILHQVSLAFKSEKIKLATYFFLPLPIFLYVLKANL